MPRQESSGTSTNSRNPPESSWTLGECFSQSLSPTINKATNDGFAALDDSTVDPEAIALGRSSEEIPRAPRISHFSRDSLSINTFASSRWDSSDAMSKVYTYSPLLVSESEKRQVIFTGKNEASAFVSGHDDLQLKVKDWLRLLPSPTGVESSQHSPRNTTPRDPSQQEPLPGQVAASADEEIPLLLEGLECEDSRITWISSTTAIVIILLQDR
ncbi:hypothetical protein FGRMN_10867 [Fusarium graminum]|nr:hypothetical protein FGRMN_10867 [Fusarium graminum]